MEEREDILKRMEERRKKMAEKLAGMGNEAFSNDLTICSDLSATSYAKVGLSSVVASRRHSALTFNRRPSEAASRR